ncbi:MAG: AMP-binding protein [Betaproteobacteria bacterium]|nr:AMP-binding protein [Betaproteobacteria bacterium]
MSAATLPLLRGFGAEETLAWHDGRPLSAQAFCAVATALAACVPSARYAFNLCESTTGFLLASAVALIAGQTLILPSTRLARTLDELLAAYPDSYCLVDTIGERNRAADVTEWAVSPQLDAARDATLNATAWPPPAIAATQTAAILFTSGSTHAPKPHAKEWGELWQGAETFLRSFGAPPPGVAILGTVPPQHMFGFETTCMLPLQSGRPVLEARPALPADLARALRTAASLGVDEVWLMTTPLQLHAFHRELTSVPGLARIISATMPLDPALARSVERDWQVTVEEIYGCTEGGILATRRPARSKYFTPAAGIKFATTASDATEVSGGHLPRSLIVTDRLRPEAPVDGDGSGRFEILGRDDDMVKIAGKRASLCGLTRELLRIPGVRDGVVFLPDPDASRLAGAIVAPGLSAVSVRASLARSVDPAFVPRPLLIVAALPRDLNGKLPHADLLALLATAREPAKSGVANGAPLLLRTSISSGHPTLPGHFPGHPIVPGVVLLELIETLLAQNGYQINACPQVKFLAQVAPGEPLDIRVDLADAPIARFAIDAAGRSAVIGRFLCSTSVVPA